MPLLLRIIKKDRAGLEEKSLKARVGDDGGAGKRDESEAPTRGFRNKRPGFLTEFLLPRVYNERIRGTVWGSLGIFRNISVKTQPSCNFICRRLN